ncbi:MAG: helix-turn-helix domain-containing protein [Planctomycetaceae bacterium]|jgi:transcriptional regulator with XRE-family HTH domain|nr:helix-turn-helix domain-containing protein [Rhodospirillales bacterium]MBT4844232.1 helix-turn-helix domain-containing protein [Planctomycetaceae bacterium]MBT4040752.1 helix-turn-helix domain-containing protein [Rhodospirillales bacterium]MBT4628029.1 helix-turn-helix domain-containing protein [Rhodospirillales bacterium]MBT5352581.1 helix-turn-helix domain-containing protein [Rhodospirillales bacterium]
MEIEKLAPLLLQRRGNMGIRAAAAEIGISPTTLSRVEKGNIPDVGTLEKICTWLGEESAKFTGIGGLQIAFKNKKSVPPKTAKSLAKLIEKASQQFSDHLSTAGH